MSFSGSTATDAPVNAGERSQHSTRSGFRGRRVDPAKLRSIPLFAQLAINHLNELADLSFQSRLEPRSLFIEENEKCDTLHAILEGTAELFSSYYGQETVIDIVQPGAVLLLASVIGGRPQAAAARTLSRARIIAVPASAICQLFDRDRAFAHAVATELSRTVCGMVEELRNLKTRTSLERVADWLLEADAQSGGSGHFKLPFGKHKLASRLGMTAESMSRSLRSLADHGVLVRGRDVTITDRAALVSRTEAGGLVQRENAGRQGGTKPTGWAGSSTQP
jgi:CRP/FNR family transcriptional activator FtrB